MFTTIEKIFILGCLVSGFVCLRCTNKALDRWEEDMKKQVALINKKTELAKKGVIV